MFRIARKPHVRSKLNGINWSDIEIIFSARELNRRADVLLNLNTMYMPNLGTEFCTGLKRFDGLKIFHVGDYYWNHPGSVFNSYLTQFGVDHLFGYGMHDRYCAYFRHVFPTFEGKVWGIPFGFSPRFVETNPFDNRLNKMVAVGSVNPFRPLQSAVHNYRETAHFYPDECWFHKFRRMLVLNRERLGDVMDSRLPVFPAIKDFGYDIVAVFNQYKMFVTCESIFFVPGAKVYEGPACGSTLICADHDCMREYGFAHGQNCIMYDQYDIEDLRAKNPYGYGPANLERR